MNIAVIKIITIIGIRLDFFICDHIYTYCSGYDHDYKHERIYKKIITIIINTIINNYKYKYNYNYNNNRYYCNHVWL